MPVIAKSVERLGISDEEYDLLGCSSVILVRNVHDSEEFTIFSAFSLIIAGEVQHGVAVEGNIFLPYVPSYVPQIVPVFSPDNRV